MGEHDTKFREQYGENDRKYWGAPVQVVNIENAFSLGETEVTFDEYDFYVRAQHRAAHPELKFPTTAKGGRGSRPVVSVSWQEATAYAAWLGARIQQQCRLPTEAEWEYAARAGKKTAYPWGDEVGEKNASCKGCGGPWGEGEQSAPVHSFAGNKMSLNDMSGNVWELTCSLWRDEFDGSEQRCDDEKDTALRVVRGGSWFDGTDFARSSARYGLNPDTRDVGIGFRVLCWSHIVICSARRHFL